MRDSVKFALATTALAVVGGLLLVGSSLAAGGAGPMGHMRMMGFGPVAHDMLKNIDTDSDGALSQDEINTAVNARFVEFDADKNGNLSLQEFQALWAEITKPIAVRAFQFLDPDGDAAVSKAELDDRFGTVVSHFDRNGDGELSRADHRHRGGHHRWHHGGRGHGPDEGGQQDEAPADE
jgi:Ca2+-binding EF-hand superfamily protein